MIALFLLFFVCFVKAQDIVGELEGIADEGDWEEPANNEWGDEGTEGEGEEEQFFDEEAPPPRRPPPPVAIRTRPQSDAAFFRTARPPRSLRTRTRGRQRPARPMMTSETFGRKVPTAGIRTVRRPPRIRRPRRPRRVSDGMGWYKWRPGGGARTM